MAALSESLDFLSWPTQVVNAVRAVLADLNLPLPVWLAQSLALVVLGLIAVYLFRSAQHSESKSLGKLVQCVGASAAVAAGLAIVVGWVDAWVDPPSRQIVGTVEGVLLSDVQFELLNYRGEPLLPEVERDSRQGVFVITYVPEFADPPSAIRVRASGCKASEVKLRRAHLKGRAEIPLHLDCK